MKTDNNHLPFSEPDDYVSRLLQKSTEAALVSRHSDRRLFPWQVAAAACTCGIVMAASALLWQRHSTAEEMARYDSPLDNFLAQISDEEAQSLFYYEIEDIPEDY